MKQHVFYSALALTAPVAVVQQAQAADVVATPITTGTLLITLTADGTSINETQLVPGTYKLTFAALTQAIEINGVAVAKDETEATVVLIEPGDIKIKGEGTITLVGADFDFPEDAITAARNFTNRFNTYDQDVRQDNATDFVLRLIGTFDTYKNYSELELYSQEGLDKFFNDVDETAAQIAKAQADTYLADFKAALATAKANLADAKDRISKLDDNDVSKAGLQAEYDTYLEKYRDYLTDWSEKYSGTALTFADDAAVEDFDLDALDALEYDDTNKDDLIFAWMKDGSVQNELDEFAGPDDTDTLPTFIKSIKDAKDAYSFFLMAKSWKTATQADLTGIQEALTTAIEGKTIDITVDGEGNYTNQAKDLSEKLAVIEAAFDTYFNDAQDADGESIGYHYYTAKDLGTSWEDLNKTKLNELVLTPISELQTALDEATAAYATAISDLQTALNDAIGEDGTGGYYGTALQSLQDDEALNYTAGGEDIYEDWRTDIETALGELQAEDQAIRDGLNDAIENGTVLSWKADNNPNVHIESDYNDLVTDGANPDTGSVKAADLNGIYEDLTGKADELKTALETAYETIDDDVLNDNSDLTGDYTDINNNINEKLEEILGAFRNHEEGNLQDFLANWATFANDINEAINDLNVKATQYAQDLADYNEVQDLYDNLKDELVNVTPTGEYEATADDIADINVSAEKWGWNSYDDIAGDNYLNNEVKEKLENMLSDALDAYEASPRTIGDYLAGIKANGGLEGQIRDAIDKYEATSQETKAQYVLIDETVKGYQDELNDLRDKFEADNAPYRNIYESNDYQYEAGVTFKDAIDDVANRIQTIIDNLNGLTSTDEQYNTDLQNLDLDGDATSGISAKIADIQAKATVQQDAADLANIKAVYDLYKGNISDEIAAAKQQVEDFRTDNLTDADDLNLLGNDIKADNRFVTDLRNRSNAIWDGTDAGTIQDVADTFDTATQDETTWTTKQEYQDAIVAMEEVERTLKDILDNTYDENQENDALATLESDLENYKTLIAAERDKKDEVDALLQVLKDKITAQEGLAAEYELDVVAAYDNAGKPFDAVRATLNQLESDVTDAFEALALTLNEPVVAPYAESGNGEWENGLKDIYDILNADDGNSGEAIDATIAAYQNAQAQTLAIRELQTLLMDAGNYIKAHTNGYTTTDTYLPAYNDGTTVPPIAEAAASANAEQDDKDAAIKVYTDQLEAQQAIVDDLNNIISGWTMDEQLDKDGNATTAVDQNAKNTEGNYRDQLLKVIEAVKKVTEDAQANVTNYDNLYNYLLDPVTNNWNAFKGEVDSSEETSTKEEWQKVVEDFKTGELTSTTIKLAEKVNDLEEYTSPIVTADCDGIDEWQEAIAALYAAGTAEADFSATNAALELLNSQIQEAYQVFNGTYDPQILADNATAWEQVLAAMQILRETFTGAKDELDSTKADAAGTDLADVVNNSAIALNTALFEYPTKISEALATAQDNKDTADGTPTLYDNATDLADIQTLTDDLKDTQQNFADKVKEHLEAYWNGGTVDGTTYVGKKNDFDLTDAYNNINGYVDENGDPADPDEVFADVNDLIAEAEGYATATWEIAKLAAAITNLDDTFDDMVAQDTYQAAKTDLTYRINDLSNKIDDDKANFDANYKDANRNVDPFEKGVFDAVYAALTAERDNAARNGAQVVDENGLLTDNVVVTDGEGNEVYGIVNISLTAAQNVFNAATAESNGKPIDAAQLPAVRADILDIINLYDTYYSGNANSLIARADAAAQDFKTKKTNAAEFNALLAALKDKLETATEQILNSYVAEDYRAKLEAFADTDIPALEGLDPMDASAQTELANVESRIDATIEAAFTAEKSKLTSEFNALHNDYNDIAADLGNAVNEAKNQYGEESNEYKEAKAAYDEFVENDGAEPDSYYERVNDALNFLNGANLVNNPLNGDDLDMLTDLVAEESIIAKLRQELSEKNGGTPAADLIAALNDKASIDTDVLGAEDEYLPYDWAALTAEKDGIDTDLANAIATIAAHEDDIQMYYDQIDSWLDNIIADVADLTAKVDPAKTDKQEYDALVAANEQAAETLTNAINSFVIPTFDEAKNKVNGFASFYGLENADTFADGYFNGIDEFIEDALEAIDTWKQEAQTEAEGYVAAGNTDWKNVDWMTATTSADDVIAHMTAPAWRSLNAVIAFTAAEVNKAAYDATRLYPATTFDGKGLLGKRSELLALCISTKYKASVLQDIKRELGTDADTEASQSIYGAGVELNAALEVFKSNRLVESNLEGLKQGIDDIVARLEAVEQALTSQLLGDLNGALASWTGDSGDGEIDVQDLQILINMVIGKTDNFKDPLPETVINAADIDDDDKITINDVTCHANLILTGARFYDWENDDYYYDEYGNPKLTRQTNNGDETLAAELISTNGNQRTYAITLDNVRNYCAFQMDIVLPEGVTLVSQNLTERANGHRLYTGTVNGANRVVVHNLFNNELKGNQGAVLTFTVEGEGAVSFDKILFSQPDGKYTEFSLKGDATGIMDRMANAYDAAKQKVYNLGGRMMNGLKKGVNILRGENGETQKVIKK